MTECRNSVFVWKPIIGALRVATKTLRDVVSPFEHVLVLT